MQPQDHPRACWEDLLRIEEQLTEEERALQAALRRFAAGELAARVRELYRSETTPRELFLQFGGMGLLGATIQGWGCAGMNSVCAGLIGFELERVDSAFHTMVSSQSNLVMHAIHRFGSQAQKDRYLPRLAAGEAIGCFGLTEPDHGSDPSRLASTARPHGDGFVLSGRKTWISNAPIADLFVIWAKAGTPAMIRGFILERGMPGLSTAAITGKLGLRASATGDVVMDEVLVPPFQVLGDAAGMRGPLACINKARYGLCWGAMGAATAVWHEARGYVLQRRQFGRPLAANQLVQKKLADMQTEIALGLAAALQAGRLLDQGRLPAEAIAMLKRNACGKALDIARTARDMLGGNGMSDAYSVMRHMCNLEALNTYEGTSDVNALVLGHAQTGISAFSI
ncbi:acyl-CoA dehydrogenase family protein [Ramlibacter tataouinensis]|uniref:Candidate glutaryl-CoA dehydrogenase n=1 Tax=Ramlibacter tataouinensis (strain ATCC BAA-407 / DSM 14655 / LMG 21543 / TTB310) TaxID=365046 RepID=F5XVI7_RAMTT|nr:acyl-CoA dehydrogenase family protein [Ramlibacter tataouinensis]AEG91563.1 Candidate glutaryl-CoA dehydrogenase [Ramlibacter tataouinensis TTB310]